MINTFYSEVATLIVILVGTTKREVSEEWQHKQSTLGSITLDIMLENIFQITLSLQIIAQAMVFNKKEARKYPAQILFTTAFTYS